ncbi:hypothetical protein [Marinobacter sp. ELB17]|uniref:hypothetical protein n=1 Tax=Marinobacter sp. ELB17 TaxID=270374 RepID=UPI0000F3B36D|nr:hypothetical protein [Marinobacter sp. ELB17]EAZ98381.1 hypothetical protein MELB17_09148 [Marinobacter sp. ELB17]
MKSKNPIDATPAMLGAVVLGSAIGKGLTGTEEHLTKTVPGKIDSNSGINIIRGFHGYLVFMGFLALIGYWLIAGDFEMYGWIAALGIIWVPLAMLMPVIFGIMGLSMAQRHISAKMKARIYEPLGREWANSGAADKVTVIFVPFQTALYAVTMLPFFILQDAVEWIKVFSSAGNHKFRTSEARYFEKQRSHYRAIWAQYGVDKAESFLKNSSISMHTPADAQISMAQWAGGYRAQIIRPLEAKYGPLMPGGNFSQKAVRDAVNQSPNGGTAKGSAGIKIKPMKGI